MSTAFLFPGQGSQHAGMGGDLYDDFPEARALFDEADAVVGFSLTDIMFGDSPENADKLRQTQLTQPALYVQSLAAHALLTERGLEPDMVAGHSLGEYSALAASGAVSFADGLRVVRIRGELMARAGDERPGSMAAILGLEDDIVERVCREVSATGQEVSPANFNAPGQIVISGDHVALQKAMDRLQHEGAKRVVPLPVSGAFHSPLMAYAKEGLEAALLDLAIRPPSCAVYLNVTASATRDPEEIRRRLLEQLLAPVRWADILRNMQRQGATRFIEVGAGNVLSGLARRTLGRGIETATAGTAADFAALSAQAE